MILSWQIVSVLVASIGVITGVAQNYLPKDRKEEKKVEEIETSEKEERHVISNETVYVGEFDQSTNFELKKGEILKGRISSDKPIDIYIVNEYNFRRWINEKSFKHLWLTEAVFETDIEFTALQKGKWHMLFERHGKEDAKVKVFLHT